MQKSIAVIGFMCAGKSTVGRLLSVQLGLPFADVDAVAEEMAGMKIPEIFSRFGEAAFRNTESRALERICCGSRSVIACGGGTLLDRGNADLLKRCCTVVLLEVSPASVLRRAAADTSERPLLGAEPDEESVRKLMEQRDGICREAADICINTDGASPDEICEELKKSLNL